jgi:hypothetical protein
MRGGDGHRAVISEPIEDDVAKGQKRSNREKV